MIKLIVQLAGYLYLGYFFLFSNAVLAVDSESARVVIISSYDSDPYRQTFDGFEKQIRKSGTPHKQEVLWVNGDRTRLREKIRELPADTSLLVTIGALATREAISEIHEIPILATLLLSGDEIESAENASGVILEYPPKVHFQWLRRILPTVKNVGVMYDPQINQKKIDQAKQAADRTGFILHAVKVSSPQEFPAALKSLSRRVEVIWGIPDKIAMSQQTAKTVLLTSFRNRIPFVGMSTAWVKAGALFSLDWDYEDLGMQTAIMAERLLNGTDISSLPLETPREERYSINLKTATHMKLKIPDTYIENANRAFR